MLMLGRGMVTDPGLALAIRCAAAQQAPHDPPVAPVPPPLTAPVPPPLTALAPAPFVAWESLLPLIADFWHIVCSRLERRQQAGRLKQWLNFLRRRYPEAEVAYMALRTVNDAAAIDAWMASYRDSEVRLAA